MYVFSKLSICLDILLRDRIVFMAFLSSMLLAVFGCFKGISVFGCFKRISIDDMQGDWTNSIHATCCMICRENHFHFDKVGSSLEHTCGCGS